MDDSLIPITSVGSSSSSQPAVGSVVRGLIELVELLGLGGASALAGRTGVVSAGDILLGQGAMVDSVFRGGRSTHSSRHVWGGMYYGGCCGWTWKGRERRTMEDE